MRQILIAARQILIAAHHILIAVVVCGLLAACGPSALDNRETADRNDDAGLSLLFFSVHLHAGGKKA